MEDYKPIKFLTDMLPVQKVAHSALLAQLKSIDKLVGALREHEFEVDLRYETSSRTNSPELMKVAAFDISENAFGRRDRIKVELNPYFDQFNAYVSGAEGPRRDAVIALIENHNLTARLEIAKR